MKRAKSLVGLVGVLAIPLTGAGCDSDPGPAGNGPVTSAPIATSPTAAPTPTMDAPPGAVQPPPTGFPCDVRAVMQASCANCHAGQLVIAWVGAGMPAGSCGALSNTP